MNVTKQHIKDAVSANILSSEQSEQLIAFLNQQTSTTAKFDFTHVLYYLGGLIAIGAMTLFMNLGWVSFGGIGIVFISLFYAAVGIKLANVFKVKGLFVPAGLCATFVVVLTPLAVFGVQQALGVWPDDTVYRDYHRYIHWHWLYMELSTLAVGVVIAWKYKYPFLVMPIAVTLWYLTMDVSVMLSDGEYSWELRTIVSMYTGLLMIALGFWVDVRTANKADYAFWIYLFGVIAFWGGLSSQHSDSELSKFFYFLINFVMIFIGVLLIRRVFVVFGAIGCTGYVGYLAAEVFADSWFFPIALTFLGLFVIYLGIKWQKNDAAITAKTRKLLPKAVQTLMDAKHL